MYIQRGGLDLTSAWVFFHSIADSSGALYLEIFPFSCSELYRMFSVSLLSGSKGVYVKIKVVDYNGK